MTRRASTRKRRELSSRSPPSAGLSRGGAGRSRREVVLRLRRGSGGGGRGTHLHARLARHAEDIDGVGASAQLQGRERCRADIHAVRIEGLLERPREEYLAGAGPLAQPRGGGPGGAGAR